MTNLTTLIPPQPTIGPSCGYSRAKDNYSFIYITPPDEVNNFVYERNYQLGEDFIRDIQNNRDISLVSAEMKAYYCTIRGFRDGFKQKLVIHFNVSILYSVIFTLEISRSFNMFFSTKIRVMIGNYEAYSYYFKNGRNLGWFDVGDFRNRDRVFLYFVSNDIGNRRPKLYDIIERCVNLIYRNRRGLGFRY